MDEVGVGVAFRMARIRRGWTQDRIAEVAGVSRSFASRLERGLLRSARLGDVERVAAALEIRLDLRLRWRGSEIERLVSGRHSTMAEIVSAQLIGAAFTVTPEASFNHFGERGVIDLLAWHPMTRCLLIVELKTEIVDVNDLLATMDRRTRLAPSIARERGWDPRLVASWVVVAEGRSNRRRLAAHRSVLRAAFPEDGRCVSGWLARPDRPVRALWFLPSSRGVRGGLALYSPRRVQAPRSPPATPRISPISDAERRPAN